MDDPLSESDFNGDAVPERPSALDRASQIVTIISGLIVIGAAILSSVKGGPAYLVWIFVVSVVALFLSLIYRRISFQWYLWSQQREDERVAREYWPRLENFVQRFGEFVDTQRQGTLHSVIMSDVQEPMRGELTARIVNPAIWSGFWYFLKRRVNRHPLGLSELKETVEEFHNLVGQYSNHCITPIFEYLPEQQRQTLTEQAKKKLNTFRERYGQFATDYMEFGKELAAARPQLKELPRYVSYPTQL